MRDSAKHSPRSHPLTPFPPSACARGSRLVPDAFHLETQLALIERLNTAALEQLTTLGRCDPPYRTWCAPPAEELRRRCCCDYVRRRNSYCGPAVCTAPARRHNGGGRAGYFLCFRGRFASRAFMGATMPSRKCSGLGVSFHLWYPQSSSWPRPVGIVLTPASAQRILSLAVANHAVLMSAITVSP